MTLWGVLLSIVTVMITKTIFVSADDGSVTFAFVIDTTRSMSGEIAAIKRGIMKMIDDNVRHIENYIMVPFEDPEVGPVFKSHDKSKIKDYLDEIEVTGGDDCPEMAMAGLLEGIKASKPNSFIFFFSDASAKDHYRSGEVTRAAKAKGMKIYFVLTGCCSDCETVGFDAYKDVERNAEAKVYQTPKAEVETFMNYVHNVATTNLERLRAPPKTFKVVKEIAHDIPTTTRRAVTTSVATSAATTTRRAVTTSVVTTAGYHQCAMATRISVERVLLAAVPIAMFLILQ